MAQRGKRLTVKNILDVLDCDNSDVEDYTSDDSDLDEVYVQPTQTNR